MDSFVIVYRVFALAIATFWVVQIAIALRQPPDWQPPRAEKFPVRITRNAYVAGGVLGIIAGLLVFGLSFVLFP